MTQFYQELEKKFTRISSLNQTRSLLYWDMSVMMPSGAGKSRAEQLSTLSVIAHNMLTSSDMSEFLDQAEGQAADLSDWQAANLREMRRLWSMASSLPADLVEAQSRASAKCEKLWRVERTGGNFKSLVPALEEIFRLAREEAGILSRELAVSPYDALLSRYEPGLSQSAIDPVFDDYALFLPDFLQEVLDHQAGLPPALLPDGPFPIKAQKRLGIRVMELMGFDFKHGRLDVSAHPFCGGTADDIRITTRYDEKDFTKSLMAVIHETGHALYERGLPGEWGMQPVGQARGMLMHESQSLLMEMQASRSDDFMKFLVPLLQDAFDISLQEREGSVWSFDNLRRLYRQVKPDFIRVDADEVTYPAHVILRYRLEKALLADELPVSDLPLAWSDGLKSLLGISPSNDSEGCLQDMHWYHGAIGYFPTYSLGAMAAAQLFDAARKALPDMPQSLSAGDFSGLLSWLRSNVHGKASFRTSDEIIKAATGKSLDTEFFKTHLRERYLAD